MRRKHFKIDELPEELVEALHQKLVDGWTYRDLADWLRSQGQPVSKSAVGRYGKDFLVRLEALKQAREKARAIVEANPDRPATEMVEAANQLAVQLILETLMKLDALDGEEVTGLLHALARLEQSGVQRERLKLEFRRRTEAVLNRVSDDDLAGKSPEEIRAIIRERIREEYGG